MHEFLFLVASFIQPAEVVLTIDKNPSDLSIYINNDFYKNGNVIRIYDNKPLTVEVHWLNEDGWHYESFILTPPPQGYRRSIKLEVPKYVHWI